MTRDYLGEIKGLLEESDLLECQREELLHALSTQPAELLARIADKNFAYSELHTHTWFSLLDGVSSIDDLLARAAELNYRGLAIADHRVTYGWYKLRQAEKKGIKPVYGCEIEVLREDKVHHLVLLAKNTTGYRNILKITSLGHLKPAKGGKPSVTKEVVEAHSEGIIALSACIGGILGSLVLEKKDEATVEKEILYWAKVFPGSFYLEIQDYSSDSGDLEPFQAKFIEEQNAVNKVLVKLSKKLGIPLVATNDVHYALKGQHVVQDILICINRKTQVSDPKRFRFSSNLHYLKSKWEMLWRFRENPLAVINTEKIVEECNVSYQQKYLLPSYPDLPEGVTEEEFFRKRTFEGLRRFYAKPQNHLPLLAKFGCSKKELWKIIEERAEEEIKVFLGMGFHGYILIVAWCVEVAREMGVLVGHARGSAAGSITALGNDITDICPLRYDLMFERFLNPDRIEMPDIDIDFQYEKREDVLRAVCERLGESRMSQVITFGRMMARYAVRDVGRVLGIDLSYVDKIAKHIPAKLTLKEALATEPALKELYESDSRTKELLDYAALIEGKPRNTSIHASAAVISSEPLTNHVALQKGNTDFLPVAQAEMGDIDGLRLVKQDFLGLRNLSIVSLAVELIGKRQGISLDPTDLPKDDPKAIKLLAAGDTIGVFQGESRGMRELFKEVAIESLEDLVDCIALYRPGVLMAGMHKQYIYNKRFPDKIAYEDVSLKKFLAPTRGILIYQEQSMQIAHHLAGFTKAEADTLRKAISKKVPKIMEVLTPKFLTGMQKVGGVSADRVKKVWDLIDLMSKYSFNKAHSVGYAYTAMDNAYLKANFPLEYMTAAIVKAAESKNPKLASYIEEAKRMGIEVLAPDINLSGVSFEVVDRKLVFGLQSIRDVGKSGDAIIEERERGGPFRDVTDFRARCPKVNRKVVHSLIYAGCFDRLGINRNTLLHNFEAIMLIQNEGAPKKGSRKSAIKPLGYEPLQLFTLPEGPVETPQPFTEVPPPTRGEIAKIEDFMLGIYISYHPLDEIKDAFEKNITARGEDLQNLEEGRVVIMGGVIKEKKEFLTKKNKTKMARMTIDDGSGELFDVIIFPKTYAQIKPFEEKEIVLIKGRTLYNEKTSSKGEAEEDGFSEEKEYDVQINAEEMVEFKKENFRFLEEVQSSSYGETPHTTSLFSLDDGEHFSFSEESTPDEGTSPISQEEDIPSQAGSMDLLSYLESLGSPTVVVL